jgi:hypothetical protein
MPVPSDGSRGRGAALLRTLAARRWVLLALLAAVGCSGGLPYGDVQGEVTLDGKPLKDGYIRFAPVDGKTPSAGAVIADGRFREQVPVGTHRIEITSPQPPKGYDPAKIRRGTIDDGTPMEDQIPPRYNLRSELTLDVKKGSNTPRFDLKQK